MKITVKIFFSIVLGLAILWFAKSAFGHPPPPGPLPGETIAAAMVYALLAPPSPPPPPVVVYPVYDPVPYYRPMYVPLPPPPHRHRHHWR